MFRRKAASGVACVVLAPFLCVPCARAQTTPASSSKTAEQVYKNIQVLKGIPADQLIPAMQFITESLGVRCDQCHVEHAFDRDDKKSKQTARKMIQMMLALNQNNFAGQREVTCYSCHRGSLRPARTPAVESEAVPLKKPVPAASPSRTVEQVLARYVQAVGGEAALHAAMTQVEKGVVNLGNGVQFPVEIFTRNPDMRSTEMHLPTGDSLEVVNGSSGWSLVPAGRCTQ